MWNGNKSKNGLRMKNTILNNGVGMPLIGMGTWPLNGCRLMFLIRKATKLGYRSFDTASAYGNEKWLGRGIKFSGKPRENLFITTKLSNFEQRDGDVRRAFKKSLKKLGLKYLDLYLIHWPNPDTYLRNWKQMEMLYREKLTRAIGVCNFHQHHLKSLLEIADVIPAVNQVELHPLLSQSSLVAFCKELGIQVIAYSPIARMHEKLIKNETIVAIAKKYKKTVPQIILRWDYQHGIVSVPKSQNPIRLKENITIFDFVLTNSEMDSIDKLDANFRVRHNPDTCDFTKL